MADAMLGIYKETEYEAQLMFVVNQLSNSGD